MKAEDYLDFEAEGGMTIRFRGTRISIYIIAEDYKAGMSAEQIHADYSHALSLEAIHFGIAYYLRNKAEIDATMAEDLVKLDAIIYSPENVARNARLNAKIDAERNRRRVAT